MAQQASITVLQATTSVAAASDRLDSLLRALPAGIVVLDGSGRIREANPVAGELLGTPLKGLAWREVAERALAPAGHGEDLQLRDGRFVHLTTGPLRGEPGQILHFQETTEIRRLRERLDHARRLSDMGRMAASLAHQLRTPLAAALLYGSHLCRPELAIDKRLDFADKLVERLRYVETLIGNMLIFARGGEAGSDRFPIAELLESLVEGEDEYRFAFRNDLATDWITGNRTLLRSAIQNLLDNAFEAAGAEGRVELRVCAGPANTIELQVRDTGPGIPPERQSWIFEPFHTTRANGSGLGLAVVSAVAKAHGGEVLVDSEPGQGSRFIIRLPSGGAAGETR